MKSPCFSNGRDAFVHSDESIHNTGVIVTKTPDKPENTPANPITSLLQASKLHYLRSYNSLNHGAIRRHGIQTYANIDGLLTSTICVGSYPKGYEAESKGSVAGAGDLLCYPEPAALFFKTYAWINLLLGRSY